ncbi:uncharacterized protein [Amphiura filiformis]|uniref:uncharacterized protein n=1 Tax=Amphiura filiformis TaxID=82378 RepID=UPI003B227626
METINRLVINAAVLALLASVCLVEAAPRDKTRKGGGAVNITCEDAGMPKGDPSLSGDKGAEVWRFARSHYNNRAEYLDEEAARIRGYNTDVVEAVCRIAGKNCFFVQDPYSHCWESPHGYDARGGIGLHGDYYEACVGWFVTKDRRRVFDFTDAFQKNVYSHFVVKTGNPNNFQYDDLTGSKIGFLESWAADEHCVNLLSDVSGLPLDESQIHYYLTQTELEAAVNADEIDAAFVTDDLAIAGNLEKNGPDIDSCLVDGVAVMVRKGSTLPSWFNPAFKKLVSTPEYEQICDDVETVHGNIPGPDKEDICLE